MSATRTLTLTAVTMIAFAANSLLCRQALGPGHIDPIAFTTVRLVSGAAILLLLVATRNARGVIAVFQEGNWRSAIALFVYALAFSLAYVTLDAGAGALILFAMVQATMIGAGLWRGDRPRALEWSGMLIAMAGLVYLLAPGLNAPPIGGAALMAVAGIAWGIYSLFGRATRNPTAATAGNFVRAAPLVLLLAVIMWPSLRSDIEGLLLAVLSGAIASGVGYALWYAALPGLAPSTAATVQLTVPAIAAVGGVMFLGESATLRLILAGALILGGVAIAIHGRKRTA